MTEYIVSYTRAAVDGFEEQKFEMSIEALDAGAAALIAGARVLGATLDTTPVGGLLELIGLSGEELAAVTADAFKDCVSVTVMKA